MDIKFLVNVTSRAWALPILAGLHDGVPGRQAPLLTATGASRTAFAQSMDHLIGIGLLERNPGHGHPLRPEFRLTKQGAGVAELASKSSICRGMKSGPASAVMDGPGADRPAQTKPVHRDQAASTDHLGSRAVAVLAIHGRAIVDSPQRRRHDAPPKADLFDDPHRGDDHQSHRRGN